MTIPMHFTNKAIVKHIYEIDSVTQRDMEE